MLWGQEENKRGQEEMGWAIFQYGVLSKVLTGKSSEEESI